MLDYASFVTRFPEFESGRDRSLQIEALIKEAYLVLDFSFWGQYQDIAAGYYVAAALSASDFNAVSGGFVSGPVTAKSVAGEYSISYASGTASSSASGGSQYDTMLDNLRRRLGGGIGLLVDVDKL